MGASCSHNNFVLLHVDPYRYTDNAKTWHFQVADAECQTCGTKHLRAIRKTCVDHGIQQPWEILDKAVCRHETVMIKNKTRDIKHKRYVGRAECVCCLNDIPVFITFDVKQLNGKMSDIQTSEWKPDKNVIRQEKQERQITQEMKRMAE